MSWLACPDFYQNTGTLWLRLSYDFALKSLFFLLLVFLLYQSVRRLPSAFRHFLLSLAFFCLSLLPLCLVCGPQWQLPFVSAPAFVNSAGKNPSGLWPFLVVGIWLTGFFVVMLRLAIGLWVTYRLKRESLPLDDALWDHDLCTSSRKLGFRGTVPILVNHRIGAAICAGIARPCIIVPAIALEWSDEQRRTILHHELGHIKRLDNLTNLLSLAVCAFYWFNPLAWWAAGRLRVCREGACDDLVLNGGTRPSRYVSYLLQAASNPRSRLISVTLSQISVLKKRVLTILDPHVNRRAIGPAQVVACSVLAALVLVSLSALQPWIIPGFKAGLGEKLGLTGISALRFGSQESPTVDGPEGRGRRQVNRQFGFLALPAGFLPAGAPSVFTDYYPTRYTTIYGATESRADLRAMIQRWGLPGGLPSHGSSWPSTSSPVTEVYSGAFDPDTRSPDDKTPSDPDTPPANPPADLEVTRVSLGTLGGDLSLASDINETGQVIGASTDGLGMSQPFVWSEAAGMSHLPCPYGDCQAIDINNSGQVLVVAADQTQAQSTSFLWSPDETLTEIGTLGGKSTRAVQVNDRGQIVGTSETSLDFESVFFWSSETGMVNLGGSRAVAINERGQVVGSASSYAFFWDSATDTFRRIGALDVQAEPLDINNRGEVVGYAYTGKSSQPKAFYWNATDGMTEIELPGMVAFSCAFRINDASEVLAVTKDYESRERTFSWQPGQRAREQSVPDFLLPHLQWNLMSAPPSSSIALIGSSLPSAKLAEELARVDFTAKDEPTTLAQLVRMNGRGQIAGNLVRPEQSEIEAVVWEIRLPKVEESIEEVLRQLPWNSPFSLRLNLETGLAALRQNDFQVVVSSLCAFKDGLAAANLTTSQSKQARWIQSVLDSLNRISHFTVIQ